ncbi:ATP-dependent DNA helicase, RecQ family protein [Cryptosporidium serpentis]
MQSKDFVQVRKLDKNSRQTSLSNFFIKTPNNKTYNNKEIAKNDNLCVNNQLDKLEEYSEYGVVDLKDIFSKRDSNAEELFNSYLAKRKKLNKDNHRTVYNTESKKLLISALEWCLNHINFSNYREGQKEAIHALVCERKDVMLILPTGGGKSLVYQLPSLLKKYQNEVGLLPISLGMVTIVVSPLIALIEDQIESLKRWKIKSNGLSSAIIRKEADESVNKALTNLHRDLEKPIPENSIVFITPESLGTERVLACLDILQSNGNLYCFAIDEAHCISEWGHDFRMAYRRLHYIKKLYPDIPILACTATASPTVQNDIINSLNLDNPFISVNSFNRPNLHYTTLDVDKNIFLSKYRTEYIILNLIHYYNKLYRQVERGKEDLKGDFTVVKNGITGIVYVNTRKLANSISEFLNSNGIKSCAYHAGLPLKSRTNIQQLWLGDEVNVLVGTIAFGMGVHKSNVRYVIHASLPDSIDAYYQQSGRAGRDSKSSSVVLLYSYRDVKSLQSIKRKSLQYLYTKNPKKAEKCLEIFNENLRKIVEYSECHVLSEGTSYYEGGSQTEIQGFQDPVKYEKSLKRYGQCRRKYILSYFGEKYKHLSSTPCCDVCDTRLPNYKADILLLFSIANNIHPKNVGTFLKKKKIYWSSEKLITQPKDDYSVDKYCYDYENLEDINNTQYEYLEKSKTSSFLYRNKCLSTNFDIPKVTNSPFASAKGMLNKSIEYRQGFSSALSLRNKLKGSGSNLLQRLKALEEDEESHSKINREFGRNL